MATRTRSEGAVSLGWVLNQLAGMSFPRPGQAYDYILRAWHAGETPALRTLRRKGLVRGRHRIEITAKGRRALSG